MDRIERLNTKRAEFIAGRIKAGAFSDSFDETVKRLITITQAWDKLLSVKN